jgi:hypothetical protein
MEQNKEKKWYDNKLVVTLLCIVFFPVGLYALWKSNTISKGWKVGVTIVIVLFVVIGVSNEDDSVSSTDTISANSQPDKDEKNKSGIIYIDKKQDIRQNDNSFNEMQLYAGKKKYSKNELVKFCEVKKSDLNKGAVYYLVFFDDKQNAKFPNNPISALYNEEKSSKHIKAIYTLNNINGYSKLDYYPKNSWESTPETVKIK